MIGIDWKFIGCSVLKFGKVKHNESNELSVAIIVISVNQLIRMSFGELYVFFLRPNPSIKKHNCI